MNTALRINPDDDYLVCKTWISDRTAPEITVTTPENPK